ncbi:unnamed protein product, partial [Pylaiella littoralis]
TGGPRGRLGGTLANVRLGGSCGTDANLGGWPISTLPTFPGWPTSCFPTFGSWPTSCFPTFGGWPTSCFPTFGVVQPQVPNLHQLGQRGHNMTQPMRLREVGRSPVRSPNYRLVGQIHHVPNLMFV